MRGVLITFEGVEGSGKSTQAQRLVRRLSGQGLPVVFSREPGGTDIGERIRAILLDPTCRTMAGRTELFLYLASRNQHVRERIAPALAEGKVVVLDRFADSSVAYQGAGRDLGLRVVARLNKLATGGLKPDLTLLVNVPLAVGRERKGATGLDRLEQERVEFHEHVQSAYLRLARRAPGRFKIIDGTRPPDELEQLIHSYVTELLKRKGMLRE